MSCITRTGNTFCAMASNRTVCKQRDRQNDSTSKLSRVQCFSDDNHRLPIPLQFAETVANSHARKFVFPARHKVTMIWSNVIYRLFKSTFLAQSSNLVRSCSNDAALAQRSIRIMFLLKRSDSQTKNFTPAGKLLVAKFTVGNFFHLSSRFLPHLRISCKPGIQSDYPGERSVSPHVDRMWHDTSTSHTMDQ